MKTITKLGCGCLSILLVLGVTLMGLLIYIGINGSETDYPDYPRNDEEIFNTSKKIEKLSGIILPEFDIIKYVAGPEDFFGDNSDTLFVSFRSANIDSLRRNLSMIKGIQLRPDSCQFDYFNENKQYSISIIIDKGTNDGKIVYFTW